MLFVTFGFLKYLRIQPISQFRAQNTNTSPCYHIIEVMPVIVYSQVSRNCCYRIPCITNPWRHIPIFPVKKFSSHKCRSRGITNILYKSNFKVIPPTNNFFYVIIVFVYFLLFLLFCILYQPLLVKA